eukprot:COSAG01_NODE_264_length_19971_cov_62.193923_17_plen_67_part_00
MLRGRLFQTPRGWVHAGGGAVVCRLPQQPCGVSEECCEGALAPAATPALEEVRLSLRWLRSGPACC